MGAVWLSMHWDKRLAASPPHTGNFQVMLMILPSIINLIREWGIDTTGVFWLVAELRTYVLLNFSESNLLANRMVDERN